MTAPRKPGPLTESVGREPATIQEWREANGRLSQRIAQVERERDEARASLVDLQSAHSTTIWDMRVARNLREAIADARARHNDCNALNQLIDALRAEVARLTAGLESIEQLTRCEVDGEPAYGPGGAQAWIILQGSNRPLEREQEKNAALRVELAAVRREEREACAKEKP
jgi:hypothetical protein